MTLTWNTVVAQRWCVCCSKKKSSSQISATQGTIFPMLLRFVLFPLIGLIFGHVTELYCVATAKLCGYQLITNLWKKKTESMHWVWEFLSLSVLPLLLPSPLNSLLLSLSPTIPLFPLTGGYVIGDHTRRIDGLVAVSRSIGDFFMQPYIIDDAFVGETQRTKEVCACTCVRLEFSLFSVLLSRPHALPLLSAQLLHLSSLRFVACVTGWVSNFGMRRCVGWNSRSKSCRHCAQWIDWF